MGMRQGKRFFFEKKNQKTFIPAVAKFLQRVLKRTKVFWFFFKKELLALPLEDQLAGGVPVNPSRMDVLGLGVVAPTTKPASLIPNSSVPPVLAGASRSSE